MVLRINQKQEKDRRGSGSEGREWRQLRRWAVAMVLLFAAFAAAYQLDSQQKPGTPSADNSILLPEANRPPDANTQMAMREQQAKNVSFDAVNQERKRQIADDSTKLLKLAGDLKIEVDKTSKDTLSLGVIRKAEEIERLAHTVKEKMKLTMGN
jgi:hypothetical protein